MRVSFGNEKQAMCKMISQDTESGLVYKIASVTDNERQKFQNSLWHQNMKRKPYIQRQPLQH